MVEPGVRKSIYIVDDDESVRDSLCALLSAHGFRPVPSQSAEDFLENFDPQNALCAFIDLRMPGIGGIELLKLLAAKAPIVPVVILTAHGDVPLAVEAMRAGAVDFIEKPGSQEQLLAAIDAAANRLANRPQPKLPQSIVTERLARLTSREKEVLDHVVLGMTNKHIADQLHISQRTVEIHRARIREKMEARGLADLIRMMK
ncbi:response regulator transcription factor [Mesorhizobium loti]|uniref:DNA-binding response regulator n=1 Tax=Mesorhizobium loti R88b TaxID=935548 RepID=A0A6M7WML0_RHILI|nr:response regulator [Mesorhizobium loti]QKD05320.1 DNA-binding response regulator [Mesorhizobium loti R88b]